MECSIVLRIIADLVSLNNMIWILFTLYTEIEKICKGNSKNYWMKILWYEIKSLPIQKNNVPIQKNQPEAFSSDGTI